MSTIFDEFLASIRTLVEPARQLLQSALDLSPRDHFGKSSGASTARQFYDAIDRWDAWRVTLVARLQRQLAEPEQLVRYAEDRFSATRFLMFYVRLPPDQVIPVDLTNRDHFLDVSGFMMIRQLLEHGREEPTWRTVRQNIMDDLGKFEQLVGRLRDELVFFGEPRSTNLAEALARLSQRAYLDNAAIKAIATMAETHFRAGQMKSCAAMLRPAVEQVIKDSYQEALRRQVLPATAVLPDMRSQADALGRNNQGGPFIDKSIAQFAYGTFALLSGLGSHTGQIDDVAGLQAWHAAIAALLMLGTRLPA